LDDKIMAIERITLLESATPHVIPAVAGHEPLASQTAHPWLGIKLEHHRMGDSERVEATSSSYLAAVCLAGQYESEYSRTASRQSFKVKTTPGDVFLTGPGVLPARQSKGNVEFLLMEVAPKFILWTAEELATGGTFEVRPLWSEREESLRYIMMTLHHELLAGCPSGRLFAEYMGLSFATVLLSKHAVAPIRLSYRGGLSRHKLRQVTEYINDNLSSSVTVTDMANLLEMGPCHFARAFKESTGMSPHQYVLRRRVERAVQMLKETSVSLAGVAYDLGFSSQGHFSTVFRKAVGVSPSDYREQVRSTRSMQEVFSCAPLVAASAGAPC
jgi:AraC family transcriptional regulator